MDVGLQKKETSVERLNARRQNQVVELMTHACRANVRPSLCMGLSSSRGTASPLRRKKSTPTMTSVHYGD